MQWNCAMSDSDKTRTIHVPGQPKPERGTGEAIGGIETQPLQAAVIGSLSIVDGPGSGQTKVVYGGTSQIGRGADSRIQLDFGDNTISRVQHAVLVYDDKHKALWIYDGGKPNPVTVNGERVLEYRQIQAGDLIRIGLTTLRFNPL